MSNQTATLPQFQNYVWELLPIRKEAVGRELVNDIVLAAVQFWPNVEVSEAATGSEAEATEMRRVAWSVRRVLEFVYGYDRFQGFWLMGAKSVLSMALEIIRMWWRRRKDNRAKITIWRRKWTHE